MSSVSIYNLVGAKVIDIDESNSIDISNLVNGTYVAVITDGINFIIISVKVLQNREMKYKAMEDQFK